MTMTICQAILNLTACCMQLIGLGSLIKSAIKSKVKISKNRFGVVDGGDATGKTMGENSATAIQYLLEEKSKILGPVIIVGLGTGLQIVAAALSLASVI